MITNKTVKIPPHRVNEGLLFHQHKLLSVQAILQLPGISFQDYADAILNANLQKQVLKKLSSLKRSNELRFELTGRILLFHHYLSSRINPPKEDSAIKDQQQILETLFTSLPYYQPDPVTKALNLRPTKVEVTSPFRIDLGMGGLSDLPPWTIERPGRTVSLCAYVEDHAPIKCIAEVVETPGVFLKAEGRGAEMSFSTWEALSNKSLPTIIAQCCLVHLLQPDNKKADLPLHIQKLIGGGLKIITFSKAPKGLGSSSIIASVILQAILRLMGCAINEQDIVHRTITIERMINVSGGWEDCLAAFYGGVVVADSKPFVHPEVTARQIYFSSNIFEAMNHRLLLYDTQIKGDSGAVLTEGIIQYLTGKPDVIDASLELIKLAGKVPDAVSKGDFQQLGELLSQQWEAWKTVTNRHCTNPIIDDLIAGATPWIEGAKVNGAGSGGAVLFVIKEGQKENLMKYLSKQTGSIVNWTPSGQGYQINEWYNPALVAEALQTNIPEYFRQNSNFQRHGRIKSCECKLLSEAQQKQERLGPVNPAIFESLYDLFLSVSITTSTYPNYSAPHAIRNIASIKKLLDGIASKVYSEEMKTWHRNIPVFISEGKDESGDIQPALKTVMQSESQKKGGLSMALDLIDGTTLAAQGLPGAYCLAAIGDGLTPFPDLQAYAILGPANILSSLDMHSIPEKSLANNITIIAEALGKKIEELTVVCHSEDTGNHHQAIIGKLQALGVTVIVPTPVIVEAPYTLAACLNDESHIDAIIGVFGLPEIVLNTILCATLHRKKGIIFTIVGNTLLKDKKACNLKNIFSMTLEEKREIERYGLEYGRRFTINDIISGKGAAFAAGVITEDKVLGLKGVYQKNNSVFVNSWLVDPFGNVLLNTIEFERHNFIDYTARYHLPLYDISLLVQIEATMGGQKLIERIETLVNKITSSAKGLYFQPLYQTADEAGLHATVFEFIVDYFPMAQKKVIDFATALKASEASISDLVKAQQVTIGKLVRSANGIYLKISFEELLLNAMARIGNFLSCEQRGLSSVNRDHHITIARFTEVLTEDSLLHIDKFIDAFNQLPTIPLMIDKFSLMECSKTPFKQIVKQHVSNFSISPGK